MMTRRYPLASSQRGAILVITLVLLLVITLAGIQLMEQTSTNKTLVQNENSRMLTEHLAQNIANDIISDIEHYLDPATISIPATYDGFTVDYTIPVCTQAKEVDGYSLSAQIVPETTHWSFTVTVTDPLTGASTKLDIGTKFNYTTGLCP